MKDKKQEENHQPKVNPNIERFKYEIAQEYGLNKQRKTVKKDGKRF